MTQAAVMAPPSCPGKDTIPPSAWATPAGGKTLYGVWSVGSVGISPGLAFNDNVNLFIPKGTRPEDEICLIRKACETRPLGLKNCDNKVIYGICG